MVTGDFVHPVFCVFFLVVPPEGGAKVGGAQRLRNARDQEKSSFSKLNLLLDLIHVEILHVPWYMCMMCTCMYVHMCQKPETQLDN